MPSSVDSRRLRRALAIMSIAAGAAHATVVADHVDVVWWYGALFGVVAILQLAWAAVLLLRDPNTATLLAGAVGHAAVLGAWATARTVGLPLVGHHGASSVGLLDGTTAIFEALIVLGILAAVSPATRRRPALQRAASVAAVVAIVVSVPVAAATVGGAGHEHDHAHHDAAEVDADHRHEPAPATPTARS